MVGDSKARRRRATKMPKKYSDYVEEDPNDNKCPSKYVAAESRYRSLAERAVEHPEAAIAKNFNPTVTIKPCFVKLLKWNFSGILPFCLVHSLYKCHCKNKAVFDSSVGDKNVVSCTNVTPPPGAPVKNRLKLRLDKTFDKEKFSSRTRGLATSYYLIRNKSLSYKSKIRKNSKKLQKELEMYLRQNAAQILEEQLGQTPTPKVCKAPSDPEVPKESKRKRKQSLIVLEDPGSGATKPFECVTNIQHNDAERELKLQRRKIKSNVKLTSQELVSSMRNNEESVVASRFGNTKKLKREFLSLLGKKPSQLRLLPWTTLAMRYNNGTFQLWYSNTSKVCPLIITENGKRPTTHHYNIKLFEQMPHESAMPSDIIRWLITNKVPLEKSPDSILLVLSYSKSYWEICGLCEKNNTDSAKAKEKVSISLIDSWNNPEKNSETTATAEPTIIDLDTEDKTENSEEKNQIRQEETEEMVHENLQESKKVMYCSKRRFQRKKLIGDETFDDESSKIRQVLWAPIPSVTLACKWRVICMNLNFAYLSLSRSSYTIKYEDIMRAMRIAQSDQTTVVLKSDELQKNYPHRNFGIYCVHNYMDKIFVGPYFLNENHDLDTLSFVNNILVNTNLFNQIKGKNVPGSGRWFHQATTADNKNDDDVVIVQDPLPVVDLTCESDEESSSPSKKPAVSVEDSEFQNQSTLLKSMLLSPVPKVGVESEEEIAKAERALDTLLKKGQINVNKTLVQLDNLKNLNRMSSPSLQSVLKANSAPAKNTILSESQNTSDGSDWNDEDRLVIDEEAEEYVKEISSEASNKSNGSPNKVNRYLITNVSGLGYISAYQHENSKIVDVICPITKRKKRFSTLEAAIAALERVFANKFIRAPTTFKIEFKMLENLEDVTEAPLDRTVLQGYHIVGAFGVKNLLHCSATELETFGLDKAQITHMWNLFERKLLWPPICQLAKLLVMPVRETSLEHSLSNILDGALREIKTLQKDSALFIREKIDLELNRVALAEKCSKLLYQLPPDERSKAQKELDRIINFSNRQILENNSASASERADGSKGKLVNVSEPIELLDDEDEDLSGKPSKSKSISITAPMKFKLSKGTVNPHTSLLSSKKVEIPSQKSLLDKKFQAKTNQQDSPKNKYVLVSRKRNSLSNLVSTSNTIDLSKCTFQIKPSNTEEKLLVKEVPIKVRKELLQVSNNRQQKQKMGNVFVPLSKTTTISTIKPAINTTSRSNVPILQPIFTSVSTPKFTVSQVSSFKNVTAPSVGVPLCKPIAVPSSSKPIDGPIKPTTMATLTPMSKPPSFILKNGTTKSTPNLIAIKEGNNYKYFQLVSENKTSKLQPVQAIKRPISSVKVKPPLKKIAPATSLLTNQKTDK